MFFILYDSLLICYLPPPGRNVIYSLVHLVTVWFSYTFIPVLIKQTCVVRPEYSRHLHNLHTMIVNNNQLKEFGTEIMHSCAPDILDIPECDYSWITIRSMNFHIVVEYCIATLYYLINYSFHFFVLCTSVTAYGLVVIKGRRIVYVTEVGVTLASSYVSQKHDNLAHVSKEKIDWVHCLWFIWQETGIHDSLVQSKGRVVTTEEEGFHKNGS